MRRAERRIFLEPLNSYANTVFCSYPLDSSSTTQIQLEQEGERVKVWEATKTEFERMIRFASENPELQFNVYTQSDRSHFPKLMKLGKPRDSSSVKVVPKIRANRERTMQTLCKATAQVLGRPPVH